MSGFCKENVDFELKQVVLSNGITLVDETVSNNRGCMT